MQNGPGKFELTLNLQEVVVLFFVMVALFTGLLFFGYGVGYRQSLNTMQSQTGALAPTQERPRVEKQAPAMDIEPEIRLENTPPQPGVAPFGWAEPRRADPAQGRSAEKPVAQRLHNRLQRPCKADAYVSSLGKARPASDRFAEQLSEWFGAEPSRDIARSWPQADQGLPGATTQDSVNRTMQDHDSEATACGRSDPPPARSVSC